MPESVNYSQMSNSDLLSIVQGGKPQQQQATDYSKMSDAELLSVIGGGQQDNESQLDKEINQPIEEDFTPSPLNPLQRAMVAFPRTMEGKIKEIENQGIPRELVGVDENNQLTINDKPITPAVHSMWDFMRDSFGKVAEEGVKALPLIGQIGADIYAASTGVGLLGLSGANALGAAGGEGFKQYVAHERTGEAYSAPDIALNAGMGAITPPAAIGVSKAIQGTKQVLMNGIAKVAEKQGFDTVTIFASQILKNMEPEQMKYALDNMRKGGVDLFDPALANENYTLDFVKNTFFGDNVAAKIQTLAKGSPQRAKAITDFYSGVLGVPEKEVQTMITQGRSISRMNKTGAMSELAENVANGIYNPKTESGLLNDVGKQLGAARIALISKAGGVDVGEGLNVVNQKLFDELTKVGFLQKEALGGYSVVPGWGGKLSTGKQQANIFQDALDRFARKGDSTSRGAALEAAAEQGDTAAFKELANMGRAGSQINLTRAGKSGTVYFPDNNLKYGEFAKRLNVYSSQLGEKEFTNLDKMAYALQDYKANLNKIGDTVAENIGDKTVPELAARYKALSEDLGPLKQIVQTGDKVGLENYLDKIAAEKDGLVQAQNWAKLDNMLKPKGIHLLDDLNAYSASRIAGELNTDVGRLRVGKTLQSIFDNAWKKDPVHDFIRTNVDPYLNPSERIIENGMNHVVAKSLQDDAISWFKTRFVGTGVLSALGFGPVGLAPGLAAGYMLQKPTVLKGLLKGATYKGGKASASKVSRKVMGAGAQALAKIMEGR